MAPSVGGMTNTAIITDTPLAPRTGRTAGRERATEQTSLITRPLLLRFVSIIGASSSFYLPLSVVPLYARSAGSDADAGLATGALLLATVAVELFTPRLVARTGYRIAMSLGLLCLGLPALALLAPPNLAVIVAVSVVRGAGFAVVTVAGGALTASLIPPQRRGPGPDRRGQRRPGAGLPAAGRMGVRSLGLRAGLRRDRGRRAARADRPPPPAGQQGPPPQARDRHA